MKLLRFLVAAGTLTLLAACGGGGGSAGSSTFGSGSGSSGGSGGGTGGGGTATPTLTLQLQLLNASGQPTTSIATGQPVRAQARLLRDGAAVADEIVQFTVEQAGQLVQLDPVAGSTLTDATGVAQVTVSSLGTASGAGRIRADAKVGTLTASGSANFITSASGSTQPSTLTLSAVAVSSASVSAYGTTGLTVRVLQNGQPYTATPVTVSFTTSCPAGKASVTPSATTQPDGTAVATFVDNGCAQTADTTVTLTASIATDTKSATTLVRSPTTGSLRFVSVDPSDKSITLRGQGGNGRQENATVTFKLVDVAGQGVGNADVCFDITTYVGGLNVDGFSPSNLPTNPGSTALCGTDPLSVVRYVKRTAPDGTVAVQVNSGTVPTPVRVRARAIYPLASSSQLESYSDTLSVSTGLPLQRSFSLSIDKANIDGGNFDGETATITVRLADQFSNPVPDGTVVNFIGSGAAVCTANNGSCRTLNGACSCNVVSQERRPLDGRVVITAYAVGLEDFDDRNGDNVYTPGTDPFVDLGDAFVDANKDGVANSQTINGDTDILIPYQQPNVFTAAGNGTRGTAHIRASTIVYLSRASSAGDPTAVIPLDSLQRRFFFDGRPATNLVRLTPICPQGTPLPQATVAFVLEDGIGNPMAAGTGVAAVDTTDNLGAAAPRPSSVLAIGARPPVPAIDVPNIPKPLTWTRINPNSTVPTAHTVTVRGVQDKCSGDASFSLQVTSPRGGAAAVRLLQEGEARSVNRRSVAVRYADPVEATVVSNTSLTATVTPESWFTSADNPPAGSSYEIDWGDGNVDPGLPISASTRSHPYATSGFKTVRLRVRDAGNTVIASASFSVLVLP